MSRNKNRVAANTADQPQVPNAPAEMQASPFNFIVPTEVVDLPSKGEFYPEGHPLHNATSVEIKHMTAREEDLLTSQSLIKKGLAINKVLESILVDKRIKVDDLLIGDKNALIIASRVYGYGSDYNVTLSCPNCGTSLDITVDLAGFEAKEIIPEESVVRTENNTFICNLPKSGFEVEFRPLTSKDEDFISKGKNRGTTNLLKLIITSINGQTDSFFIERALQVLPILDSSMLKKAYASVSPDVDMSHDAECTNCGHEFNVEVPLTAEFFWPNL